MNMQKLTILDAARIASQLQAFKGAKIQNIFCDTGKNAFYIQLTSKPEILKYSNERTISYIGITDQIPSECQAAANYLAECVIGDIRQLNRDRIIVMDIIKNDRLGRIQERQLIFELMPNIGDIYLTDKSNKIYWSMKNKQTEIYQAPRLIDKLSIFDLDRIYELENGNDYTEISKKLLGLNKRDILNLLENPIVAAKSFGEMLADYVARAILPGPAWIIFENDLPAGFSLVKPVLKNDENAQPFDSALIMYELYYGKLPEQDRDAIQTESILRLVQKELIKEEKRLAAIQRPLDEARNNLKYKLWGDLLLANIENIPKGAKVAALKSHESENDELISIKLDPSKSASANAAAYFKKYKKGTSSKAILEKRYAEAIERINLLKSLIERYTDDPERLRAEAVKLKIINPVSKKSVQKKIEPRKPYRHFKASCGWDIFVGKASSDNDVLTFEIAAKHDYWFHAWQAAGSHTVLRLPDKNAIPDKQTLLEAASLAAYYSKARNSSKVPVAYTQVRFVHKPRKFAAGKVLVEKEKQLMVKPANPDNYVISDTND